MRPQAPKQWHWGAAAPTRRPRFSEPVRVVFCQGVFSWLGLEDSHKSVSGHLTRVSNAKLNRHSIGPDAPTIYKPLTRQYYTSQLASSVGTHTEEKVEGGKGEVVSGRVGGGAGLETIAKPSLSPSGPQNHRAPTQPGPIQDLV